jgi:hypothetical protein
VAKQADATRAPRGTKTLIKAFFDAADQIPEPQRAEVVKAALGGIREQIAAMREKQKAAKLNARGTTAKTAKKAPATQKAARKVAAKPAVRKARPVATPDPNPASAAAEDAS